MAMHPLGQVCPTQWVRNESCVCVCVFLRSVGRCFLLSRAAFAVRWDDANTSIFGSRMPWINGGSWDETWKAWPETRFRKIWREIRERESWYHEYRKQACRYAFSRIKLNRMHMETWPIMPLRYCWITTLIQMSAASSRACYTLFLPLHIISTLDESLY